MCAVLVRSGRPGVSEGLSRTRMGSLVNVDHPGASESNCAASVLGPLASSKTRYSQVSERSICWCRMNIGCVMDVCSHGHPQHGVSPRPGAGRERRAAESGARPEGRSSAHLLHGVSGRISSEAPERISSAAGGSGAAAPAEPEDPWAGMAHTEPKRPSTFVPPSPTP